MYSFSSDFFDIYRDFLISIIGLREYDRQSLNTAFCQILGKLSVDRERVYKAPKFFMEEFIDGRTPDDEWNVLQDPLRGRRIHFNTVHDVKGETHDATLYLETEKSKSSDIVRVLPYFGVGRPGPSSLFDFSRKLVYVGMSRPRKLLCLAIQKSTYKRSKDVFRDWDIIDISDRISDG